MAMTKTYAYSYMQFAVTARLGDALELKMGFRTQTVPIESLRFVYVAANGDHQELIVAYDKPDGRRGIARSYSNRGDSQFKALVDDLAALRPSGDLRQLPRREALKTMGARDSQLIAIAVVPIAIITIALIGTAPMILHGFDHGSQRVDVAELGKVKLTTGNLVVKGELDTERYLEITHTKNGSKTHSEYELPVYPSGAPDGTFVPLVLRTSELGEEALDLLAARGEWKCTLQNLLWEGLSSEDRDYLKDKLQHNVTRDTMLCELDDGKRLPVTALLGIIFCSSLFISAIIAVAILLQRRKQR
jgi:hypothetical protein